MDEVIVLNFTPGVMILDLQGTPQIPTSRKILEDLQSADPNDVVFTSPPIEKDSTGIPEEVQRAMDLVNATTYLKEKREKELSQVISEMSNHIDELRTALKTLSSER